MTEEPIESKAARGSQTSLASLLVCLPAVPIFAALIYDLTLHQGNLSANVAMQMEAARRINSGELVYLDFWDWAQPLVVYAAALPLMLHQLLESLHSYVRLELISKYLNMALVLLSFALSVNLSKKIACDSEEEKNEKERERDEEKTPNLSLPLSLPVSISVALAVACYAVRFQFGEVQTQFILAFMPYLLLRYIRHSRPGLKIAAWQAYLTGLLAGLGICLDVTFWPLPLLLELLFVLYKGKLKPPPSRFEFAGLITAILIAFAAFSSLNNLQQAAFIKWIMPLRLASLMVFDRALLPLAVTPDRRDIIYMLCLAMVTGAALVRRNLLYMPLMAAALWGLVIYLCEGQGLSEQLALCTYCTTVILVLAYFDLAQALQRLTARLIPAAKAPSQFTFIGTTTLLTTVAAVTFFNQSQYAFDQALSVRPEKNAIRYPDVEQTLEKYTKWQDDVILISYSAKSIYPTLTNLERHQCGYLLSAQPLYLLAMLDELGWLSKDLKDYRNALVQKLTHDFTCGQPKIILVDIMREQETLESLKLLEVLEQKYDRIGLCNYYNAYREPREHIGLNLPLAIYHLKTDQLKPEQTQKRNPQ